MALETTDIQTKIEGEFGDKVSNFRMERDILTFDASKEAIEQVIRFMKEDSTLRFNFLTDLCGMHYPDNDKSEQFAVVYLMHNWMDNVRVRIKTFLPADKVEVSTVTTVFKCANWMERETYDFFGVKFVGHPNLKRILNADSLTSYPMRKEHPLEDAGRSDKDDRFFGRTTNNYEVNNNTK